jgi:hypothetical protein
MTEGLLAKLRGHGWKRPYLPILERREMNSSRVPVALAGAPGRPALVPKVIPALLVVLMFLMAGCSAAAPASQSPTKTPSSSPQIESGAKYSIAVFRGETSAGTLTLADLSKLDKVKFTADGKNEEGPTLMSALALVGIVEFSTVTVSGFTPGRLGTAEITLKRAEITDRVILDFSNQGTCKLAGDAILSKNWIVDVNKMVLK